MPASSSAPTNQPARSATARCNRPGMAVPGRHVPAGHHRGGDGGAGGEHAAGGAGPAGRRAAGDPAATTLADRESALPPSRGEARSPPRSLEADHVAGHREQSAVSVVTPIEPARGPADDLVPVGGPSTVPARRDAGSPAGRARRGTSAGSRPRRCGPGPGSGCPRRTRARGGARAAPGRARICEPGRPRSARQIQ
jgi:hypothetical protein